MIRRVVGYGYRNDGVYIITNKGEKIYPILDDAIMNGEIEAVCEFLRTVDVDNYIREMIGKEFRFDEHGSFEEV